MRVNKITLLGMAVVSVTVAGIWWPEIRHNWVRTPHYSAASLQSLRTQPSAALLAKLAKIQFEPDEQVLGRDATIFEAERILKGAAVDLAAVCRLRPAPRRAAARVAVWQRRRR